MKRLTIVFLYVVATSYSDALNLLGIFRSGRKKIDDSEALPPPPVYDLDVSELFEGNEAFRGEKLQQDPQFFNKLGMTHKPKYLFIGSADSRVSPNNIMGIDAGSVLTVRNVGNLVVNNDLAVMSAIQYGINELEIPHVILCGNYGCDGIKASLSNVDPGSPLSLWLQNLRDVYRLHAKELDSITDPEDRHRRLVDLNVIEQSVNLFKTGVIQAKRLETYKKFGTGLPKIHPVVFDPKTGRLKKLKVDFDRYMSELNNIYDLYDLEHAQIPMAS